MFVTNNVYLQMPVRRYLENLKRHSIQSWERMYKNFGIYGERTVPDNVVPLGTPEKTLLISLKHVEEDCLGLKI